MSQAGTCQECQARVPLQPLAVPGGRVLPLPFLGLNVPPPHLVYGWEVLLKGFPSVILGPDNSARVSPVYLLLPLKCCSEKFYIPRLFGNCRTQASLKAVLRTERLGDEIFRRGQHSY